MHKTCCPAVAILLVTVYRNKQWQKGLGEMWCQGGAKGLSSKAYILARCQQLEAYNGPLEHINTNGRVKFWRAQAHRQI